MDKAIKTEWIARLRSGDYKQGVSALHTIDVGGDLFCCLGVLCQMAEEQGVVTSSIPNGFIKHYMCTSATDSGDQSPVTLPMAVQEWSGVNSASGSLRPEVEDSLSSLNDHGSTFDEIADMIDRFF
jgi:hypothetical protein